MRKSTTYLLAFALGLFGAQAQTQSDANTVQERPNVGDHTIYVKSTNYVKRDRPETPVFSENFSTGIPSGWSTYGTDGTGNPLTNAVWEYRGPNTTPNNTVGSRGAYAGTRGPIQSATASNGFVIFDSDYLDNDGIAGNFGQGVAPAPHIGYLESPVINLSNDNFVELSFYSYHRYFQGRCRIQFSDDGGVTWNAGQVTIHLDVSVNNETAPNAWVSVDASPYIGGEQNAKFRLMFDGTPGNGDAYYFWMVDDIEINALPEYELRYAVLPGGAPDKNIFFNAPPVDVRSKNDKLTAKYGLSTLKQARSVSFDCNIFNYGYGTNTNVEFEVEIYDNASNLVSTLSAPSVTSIAYSDTVDYNTLVTTSTWTPTAQGSYNAVYKVSSTQFTTPIIDTVPFLINDSIMGLDFQTAQNSIGTSSTGEADGLELGNLIELENDERLFKAWIRLSTLTVPGGFIEVEVYDTTGFDFVAGFPGAPLVTANYTITQADVTNGFATVDLTNNGVPAYLTQGGYYVILRMFSNGGQNHIQVFNHQRIVQTALASIFYFPSAGRYYIGYSNSRALNAPLIRVFTCPAATAATCMQIGIEELFTEMNLKVGQDDENIFVNFSDVRGNFNLELVDMNGRTLHSNRVKVDNSHRETIGVNHLSPGIYILKVANGEKMNTYKLIIQ